MPGDTQFPFDVDPTKIAQEEQNRQEAMRLRLGGKTKEARYAEELERREADIQAAYARMSRKRERQTADAMAQSRRGRVIGGIMNSARATQMDSFGRHIAAQDATRASTFQAGAMARHEGGMEFMRGQAAETKAATASVGEFGMSLKGAAGALLSVISGLELLGSTLHGAGEKRAGVANEVGGTAQQVQRAAQTLGLPYNVLLNRVTRSPDREGALRALNERVALKMQSGIGTNAAQAESMFGSTDSGAYTWDQAMAMMHQRNYVPRRPGLARNMVGGQYTDAQRGVNVSEYTFMNNAFTKDPRAAFLGMSQLVGEKGFSALNPVTSSLPFGLGSTATELAGAAAAPMIDAAGQRMLGGTQSFDQPTTLGAAQNPFVPGSVDMSSGGRGAAVEVGKQIGHAIKGVIDRRRPDPNAGNTP